MVPRLAVRKPFSGAAIPSASIPKKTPEIAAKLINPKLPFPPGPGRRVAVGTKGKLAPMGDGVRVGESVGVGVGVWASVGVAVGVDVFVLVGVWVGVSVGVGVMAISYSLKSW